MRGTLAMTLPKLYPILDTATLEQRDASLLSATRAFLKAGATLLQIRHKGHWSRDIFTEAEAAAQLCRERGATLIVNDRADIAVLLDAGLHIGQDDLPPAVARRLIGANRVLGFSTHSQAQVIAAALEPVDYIAIGPIFPTKSKQRPDPTLGLDHIRNWRALVKIPLVAIGGIDRGNAQSVLNAGADSVAIIGDLYPDSATEQTLFERAAEWHKLINP
jgi:thiamine-phosphate pyrophosphorylase